MLIKRGKLAIREKKPTLPVLCECVLFEFSCSLVSLLFHFYPRIKLTFRERGKSVLYTLLSNDFQNIICFINILYFISGGIEAKCNEASTLLEVIQKRTEKFRGQIKNLYTLQRSVCISLKISHISLHAIGFACGKAVRDSISRNIPYIEQSSKTLFYMCQRPEKTVCAALNITSTRTVVAPVVGKQAASGIAKKTSLRVIGTAAVCIAILVDVAKIANNRAALNQGKHSDLVTRLEDVANEMETEMKDDIKRYDKIVGG